jgi:hypothetical protein
MLEVEERVRDVLAALRPYAPARFLDDAEELNAAGEPGVAIENLCENLADEEVPVPQPLVARLRELCDVMRLKERYWQDLTILPVPAP